MARQRAPLRGALLLLVSLAIAVAAAVPALAAEPLDPRCAAWEAASEPPPGINMATVCPPAAIASEAMALDKEPLVPYVVGLVVMGVVLGAFGVIAMRVMSPRRERQASTAADWWACPSCGVRNRPDREHCFACEASRDSSPGPSAAAVDPAPATEGPHPA